MRDTGKRILKKLGGKGWIAVAVVGLALGVGSSSPAVEAEINAPQTVEKTQAQRTQTAVTWRSHTIVEVNAEMQAQQVEENNDVYTVQWGDTLWAISQALDTTVSHLSQLNQIANPDMIYAGEVLRLTSGLVTEPSLTDQKLTIKQEKNVLERMTPTDAPVEAPRVNPVVNTHTEPVIENREDSVVVTEDPIIQEPVQLPEPEETSHVSEPGSELVASEEPEVPESNPATEGTPEDEVIDVNPGLNTGGESQIIPGKSDVLIDEQTTVTPIAPPAEATGEAETAYVINLVETIQTYSEPFATEYRGDPYSETGERRVAQEGVNGQYQIITTYGERSDGTTTEPISERVALVTPMNELIEIIASQEVIQTVERTIPLIAGVEYLETSELLVGEERVVRVGQYGYRVEVYEQLVIDGIVQSETLIETKEETAAQNEIIEVGTATVPEITTEIRVETATIPFEITTEENPHLPVGTEQVLQEGLDQIVEITYEETYENDEVVEAVEVSRQVVQEGQPEIIEVGTQEEPELPVNDTAILRELDKEPEAVKYEKATQGTLDESNGDGSYTILSPSPHSGLVSDPYNLTPEMIAYYMANVDINLLNQEFGVLLNAARAAQGKQPVTYMPEYQAGVDQRTNELASIGHLRVGGQSHVRLDGRPFDTAFDYLEANKGGVGENLAGMNYDGNPYELLSEKYLAEQAYDAWLNSPSHKINQEDAMYNGFAVNIIPIGDVGWSEGVYDSGYIAALALVSK